MPNSGFQKIKKNVSMKFKKDMFKKSKSFGWHAHGIFAYNVWQEVDGDHPDKIINDPKTSAVVMLDNYDMKPMSLLIFCHKTKVPKQN